MDFDAVPYTVDVDTAHLIASMFMFAITAVGFAISFKVKRAMVFRFKLALVYTIPAMLGMAYLTPASYIYHPYRVLLICAFIGLFQILYWREVKPETTSMGFAKSRLPDFIDIVPDMVWMKDLDNRFIYTNEAIREGLLKCTEKEAFGRTGIELAELQRAKGHEYTFGEVCDDSDDITLDRETACRFLEFGTVNGEFLALQVFKAPVYTTAYDGKKVLAGTIGMGRDLTYDFQDHEKISKLVEEGKVKEACAAFEVHKNRHMFTGIDLIRRREDGVYDMKWEKRNVDIS